MIGHILPESFVLESNENLGAIQITTFLSLVLCGVLLSQGYTYYGRTTDRWSLKALVGVLLFFECAHSFTASQTIYYDTVTRFKNAQPNSYPLTTTVALETLITVMVQTFFSYRIYRLSGNLILTFACLSLAVLRFVGGVSLTVYSFMDVPHNENGLMFVVDLSWLITSSLACGGAADVLIAVLMLFYLRKLASPMNQTSTTETINRLVRWSLQTGLITSMTSVAVIISFQANANMIWFGLYILLAKIYSNSLLVSLNARPCMRKELDLDAAPNFSTRLQFGVNSLPVISVSFRTTPLNQSMMTDVPPPVPPKLSERDHNLSRQLLEEKVDGVDMRTSIDKKTLDNRSLTCIRTSTRD